MRVGKNSEGTTESHSQSCNLNLILNCDGLTTWTEREGGENKSYKNREKEDKRQKESKKNVCTTKGGKINTKTENSKRGLKHEKEKTRGEQKKGAKLIITLLFFWHNVRPSLRGNHDFDV